MKTKKPKSGERYIVLVARSRKDMAKGLFSMCRFKGDDVVLFFNGRPVVPTLFKSREVAENKVGDQKMFLNFETLLLFSLFLRLLTSSESVWQQFCLVMPNAHLSPTQCC